MEATVRQRVLRATFFIVLGLGALLLISGRPRDAWLTPAFLALAIPTTLWTIAENAMLKQDEPPNYRGKLTTRLNQASVMGGLVLAAFEHYRLGSLLIPQSTAVVLAGGAVVLVGIYFRLAAIRTLDRHFRYELRVAEGQRVVTSGPYRLVRHPSYLGILLIATGGALIFSSILGIVVGGVANFIVFTVRMRDEERMMLDTFGDEYATYLKRTWRLLPPVY